MKDWVKPYLNKQYKCIGDCKEGDFYSELTMELECDFGRPYDDVNRDRIDYFTGIFGSVLADLPKKVFKSFAKFKNLFFIFTPCPGAEVKFFQLRKGLRKGRPLRIVNFPYSLLQIPEEGIETFTREKVIRGHIVHELSHIFSGDEISSDDIELRADETARGWGFDAEIEAKQALNRYWAKQEKEVI